MKTFDSIIIALTLGVAKVLRGLLKVYNRLIALNKPTEPPPFGGCNKIVRLRNNRIVNDASDEWLSFPVTTEEKAPQRRIVQ